MKRTWPDINGLAVIAFIVATIRGFWRKHQAPPSRSGKVLPFTGYSAVGDPERESILTQGQKQAGELAAKVTTDGQRVDGEVSVQAQGQSWAAKLWARVTAQREHKPDVAAGVEFQKRWFGGW